MVNDFSNISIRGRLAFGMTCIEKVVIALKADHVLLNGIVFPSVWEFTSTDDFSEWEQTITTVDPICVLDEDDDTDLKNLYGKLPKDIVSLLEDVIEIGTANIYGAIVNDSQETLSPLKSVIEKMIKLNVLLPDIEPFKKSSFGECHGWGDKHTREYFLN